MRLVPTLFFVGASMAAIAPVGCTRSQPAKPDAAAAAPNAVQGTVQEVLAAPPYSYLRIKTAQGDIWTAVPATDLKAGAPATVQVQVRLTSFQSASLKRTFDVLCMGTLAGEGPAAAAGALVSQAVAAPPAVEKVAKASGADAYAIAEIYARKDQLKGQDVVVKAKVMKAIGGIMGKTWLHLCDGSGDSKASSFDLPVTTVDTGAKVGDVVTVKGVLHLNRDFGSGYTYPIIVEDARIVR